MLTPQELNLITQLSSALEEQSVLNIKQNKLNEVVAAHVKDAKRANKTNICWLVVVSLALGYILYSF